MNKQKDYGKIKELCECISAIINTMQYETGKAELIDLGENYDNMTNELKILLN